MRRAACGVRRAACDVRPLPQVERFIDHCNSRAGPGKVTLAEIQKHMRESAPPELICNIPRSSLSYMLTKHISCATLRRLRRFPALGDVLDVCARENSSGRQWRRRGVRPVHAFGTCSCASGDTKVRGKRLGRSRARELGRQALQRNRSNERVKSGSRLQHGNMALARTPPRVSVPKWPAWSPRMIRMHQISPSRP